VFNKSIPWKEVQGDWLGVIRAIGDVTTREEPRIVAKRNGASTRVGVKPMVVNLCGWGQERVG